MLPNSYEVIVRTPTYEQNLKDIDSMISSLRTTFETNQELNDLIEALNKFLGAYGKRGKNGYPLSSAINKGLGRGNRILNIPEELTPYKAFIESEDNVSFIDWQQSGIGFLKLDEKCPFCTNGISDNDKMRINHFAESYDKNSIGHLNNVLAVQ